MCDWQGNDYKECFVADLFLSSLFLQVSVGVPSQRSVFTFVPSVWKLPIESIITEEARSGAGSTDKVQQQHILQNHSKPSLFIVTLFMTNHSTKCDNLVFVGHRVGLV